MQAVLLHRDGASLAERYTGSTPEDSWDTQSVTKSVVGTLVGISVGEGHIAGVESTLGELLPSPRGEMSAETADVTLHHVGRPYRRVRSRYRQPRTGVPRGARLGRAHPGRPQ